ncbi:DegT/DnrJ/EryC1/StrS family aminotransferase [Prochlorococcus marinus]|uniref:DegT/DnrJ/EryC1/StrS family aminotransferase n=1 Tax=Prochlorococcus marinus TaxID=1219 RepID=UPI0022B59865|nr:DegT/DnrJ/EryC1/StrS family aminotransferase [Prochlorococcus marinus]
MNKKLSKKLSTNNKSEKIFYAESDYSQDEIDAVIDVLKNNRLSLMVGKQVKLLEEKVANIFNKNYGLMVNSGSSANLISLLSLKLKAGSRVITPSLTFSTTIAPIVQSNLIPYFVDVEEETLQINTSRLKEIDLDNVSAICVPNLIGNIANWNEIYNFAKENNLKIIEDSADTIGYTYRTKLDNWSDISTTSFYASHVITGAGFGGMVSYSNSDDYYQGLSLRGWGRRSCMYGETEDYERRFASKIDGLDYDDKYIFDQIGFNFLPSEISAAFALVQLDKLKANLKKRSDNFNFLRKEFSSSNNFFIPFSYDNVETGWLAFPLIFRNKLALKRKDIQIFLEKAGIQTRTIFSGNIMRQPVAEKFSWDKFGSFEVSDNIMKSGILLGIHNRQSQDNLNYIVNKVFEAEYLFAN